LCLKLNKKERYMSLFKGSQKQLIKSLNYDRSIDCHIGKIHSELFDKDVEVIIENGASIEYAELCVSHFHNLSQDVVDQICERLYKYYQFVLEEFGKEEIDPLLSEFINCTPVEVTPQTMLQYIGIQSIAIEEPEKDIAAYSISGCCAWEPEHGVEIIINGDKVLYVGEFSGIGPWRDNESYICVF
jgi:hypothetical protein